jgi:hypothetical protein
VATQGLTRLINPAASTPGFSLTRWQVQWQPEAPKAGEDVRVSATASGEMPTGVRLVAADASGQPQRWHMQRQTEGRYSYRLMDLRRPQRFFIETDAGRTRVFRIVPTHESGPSEAGTQSPSSSASVERSDTPAANREAGSTQPAQPGNAASVKKQLRRLAQALQRLGERLNAAEQKGSASRGAKPRSLDEQLASLRKRVARLSKQLARASKRRNDAALVRRTREALKQLEAAAQRLAQNRGDARPRGVGRAADSHAKQRQALQQGAKKLTSLAAEWGRMSGRAARGPGQPPGRLPSMPQARGAFFEGQQQGSDELPAGYERRDVPGEYRELVDAYFNRLNEDRSEE